MKTLGRTKKRFTLVFECVDPPIPLQTVNSDSFEKLWRMFNDFIIREIKEYDDCLCYGGEWTLTLYQHTPETVVKTFATELPDYFPEKEKHVYAVTFVNSLVLLTFRWTDLFNQERRKDIGKDFYSLLTKVIT